MPILQAERNRNPNPALDGDHREVAWFKLLNSAFEHNINIQSMDKIEPMPTKSVLAKRQPLPNEINFL